MLTRNHFIEKLLSLFKSSAHYFITVIHSYGDSYERKTSENK